MSETEARAEQVGWACDLCGDCVCHETAQSREQRLQQALERLVWHHTEGEGTENPHNDSVWESAYAALAATPTQAGEPS